jgi:hypothetical protein
MVGLILPIVLATVLALVLGGSLAGWARQHVHWWSGILAAFAIQLILFNPPVDEQPWAITWGPSIWVVSMLLVAVVLLRNSLASRTMRLAWAVAALGVGLNVLVVVANGGYMPRAPEASAVVGTPVEAPGGHRLQNVTPLGGETQLGLLSDIIPQPAWLPRANVVSVGDLLLSGGAAWWAFQATASVRRRRALPPHHGTQPRRGHAT